MVLLRLALRLKMFGRFKLDDYLVLASFLLFLSSTLVWTVLAKDLYLTLDNVTNPNLDQLLDLLHKAADALHGNLASYLCTWTSLYLIKLAFMVFFHGLGRQVRSQRILWWCTLAFIAASYATTLGLMDYKCLTSVGLDMIGTFTREGVGGREPWISHSVLTESVRHIDNCRTQKVVDFEFVTTRVQTTLDIVTDASSGWPSLITHLYLCT